MWRSAVLSDTLWFDLCRRRDYWTDRLEQRDRRDAAAGQNERDSVDDDTLQETGHSRPQRRPQPRPKQQQQQQQQARRRQGVARSKRQERRRPASEGMEAIPTKLDAAQWVMSVVAKQPHVMAIFVVLLVLATSWMLADQEAGDDPGAAKYGARPTGGGGRGRARKGSDSISIESPRSHAAIASRTQAERALALLFEGCPPSGQSEFCGAFRPQGVHRGFPHYKNSAGTHLYRHTGRQKWLISPYFTPEDDLSKVRKRLYSCSKPHSQLG